MTATVTHTDVVIVGAGPTGLSLACQLIRYGIDFVIIDSKEDVTPYSKALGVHARTLEIYEQLGIAEQAVAQGTIAGKLRLVYANKIRGELNLSNIGEGMSQYPYMLVLEQSKNEQLLYDYLQTHGKDVLWQTTLDSLSQTDTEVTAQVTHARGNTSVIKAKYLVGCDGPKSPVRHGLGLSFEGSTFERLFYVADVHIDWRFSHDALHVCLTPNSVVAFFPMPGENRYRIVGAFPEGFDKDEGEALYEEIEQRIKTEAQIGLEISQVNWFSTYKVHARHVENFAAGRCFLAGDAAHIHTPAGGQGMNTGIQDVYNLAWKLAFVLRGNADRKILDSYNEERLPNAQRLLKTTDRMFNFLANSNKLVNFFRTIILPPLANYLVNLNFLKKRFFPVISQIGISYRNLSLSQIHSNQLRYNQYLSDKKFKVKAGDRMPYFLVDGISIYNRLREPKFHLITFTSETENIHLDKNETSAKYNNKYADILDYQVLPLSPELATMFGTNKTFTLLLRPDNYIGFITSDPTLHTLELYLQVTIGHP
ncbi:MAG TPA: FAD-dependent monooxygenase [Methylotenera sp.]|nr:FAD-dependent monooxygenase [Methylotenera sp.]